MEKFEGLGGVYDDGEVGEGNDDSDDTGDDDDIQFVGTFRGLESFRKDLWQSIGGGLL